MNETKTNSAPRSEDPRTTPAPSAKEMAARMATTTEATARWFAGPTKDFRLKLLREDEYIVTRTACSPTR